LTGSAFATWLGKSTVDTKREVHGVNGGGNSLFFTDTMVPPNTSTPSPTLYRVIVLGPFFFRPVVVFAM
jgi:hypothetical protein